MKKNLLIGGSGIVLGVLLDQIIKIIVRAKMAISSSFDVIPGFFSISHIENTGAAWGSLSDNTILLIIISFVLIIGLLFLYRLVDFKKKKMYSISLTLMISGAIGNLIDRLAFHSVTDYLDFNIIGYDFPVFNLADCLLVVGFFLIAINELIKEFKKEKTEVTNNNDEIKEDKNDEGTNDNN